MKIGLLELVVILVAPLIVMLITMFVLILVFVTRRTAPATRPAPEPKLEFCPNCNHKLVEVRNFCAECGASIRHGPPSLPAGTELRQ
ncbi:MAG: zinc ribbon domain-containing protein [Chloroflexi bacterium]|nr:zinc ribbon domain-containing protein [Chloroflexota bacterium]